MKIQLILVFSIWGNLLYAANALSQTTVSMQLDDVEIATLFSEIEKNTDYVVLCKEDVPLKKRVTVNAVNKSVDSVLNEALVPLNLRYHVNGKQIIVAANKVIAKQTESAARQQQVPKKTISGTVLDKDKIPLIGVSVLVKGSGLGTITDMDGYYSLNVAGDAVLVFSYVGYVKQEIPVNGKGVVNVILLADNKIMDEVVVVGYGKQKKINLTGAVGVLDTKVIENRPTGNAVQALQGAIPGLRITMNNTGGQLDGTMDIKIRGDKSGVGDGSDNPLVLIDGMEGSLYSINPQDIESISVLKDAAASAIYGSRAPYGVILVTTKSGKSDKAATVSYNNNFRYGTPIHMPEAANSYEYMSFIDAASMNAASSKPYYDAQRKQNALDYINGTLINPATNAFDPNYTTVIDGTTGKWDDSKSWANANWLGEYFRDWSSSQEHNVTVSGGAEKIQYYLSANYQSQEGFLRHGDDNRQRYNLTGKISAQVHEALKVDFTSRFSRIDYDKPARLNNSFFEEVLRRAVPMSPIVTPDGLNKGGFVPVLEEGGRITNQNEDLALQLKATLTPVKNLNIIGELNARIQNNWEHSHWIPVYSYYANDPDRTYLNFLSTAAQYANANGKEKTDLYPDGQPVGSVSEVAARYTQLTPNLYASYDFLVDKHHIIPLAGVQVETYNLRNVGAQRYNMISWETPVLSQTTSQYPDDIFIKGETGGWATLGCFARLSYSYDNRYLLEINGRRDATSRYRADMRWVTSPSASLGWNIANEPFFKPLGKYIPYLKLRASYGMLANQNLGSTLEKFYPTYTDMNFVAGGGNWLIDGLQPNSASMPALVSALLTWEKINTANFGIDWGFFNSRLSGSFDIFNRRSIGLMGPGEEYPAVYGATAPRVNNTDLETTGFELEISWKDRIKDLLYSVTLTLADDQARVLKYPNPTGALSKPVEGQLTGNIYGYTTIGIAQTKEEMLAHLEGLRDRRIALGLDLIGVDGLGGQPDGGLGRGLSAGDVMYADINGDGRISTGDNTIYNMGDLKVIGNTRPRYQTSALVNLDWKGIDLQMYWQGVLKRDFYPDPNNDSGLTSGQDLSMLFWGATRGGAAWSTALKEHMDYFRPEDDPLGANLNAYYPAPIFNTRNQHKQTRYLQNAAYLRLKNLQIGYTLPVKWTKTAGISRFRIFATAENLLTFTEMSPLLDPEVAGYGVKGGMIYPMSKTYAFGINVNF